MQQEKLAPSLALFSGLLHQCKFLDFSFSIKMKKYIGINHFKNIYEDAKIFLRKRKVNNNSKERKKERKKERTIKRKKERKERKKERKGKKERKKKKKKETF